MAIQWLLLTVSAGCITFMALWAWKNSPVAFASLGAGVVGFAIALYFLLSENTSGTVSYSEAGESLGIVATILVVVISLCLTIAVVLYGVHLYKGEHGRGGQ